MVVKIPTTVVWGGGDSGF